MLNGELVVSPSPNAFATANDFQEALSVVPSFCVPICSGTNGVMCHNIYDVLVPALQGILIYRLLPPSSVLGNSPLPGGSNVCGLFSHGLFNLADEVLDFAPILLDLSIGCQIRIVGEFSSFLLDRAFHLVKSPCCLIVSARFHKDDPLCSVTDFIG
jgi:hypothetical protein